MGSWYVQVGDGPAQGPLSTEQVTEGLRSGQLPPSALICPVGGAEWAPLAAHPSFHGLFPRATPSPQPTFQRATQVRSRTPLLIGGIAGVLLIVGAIAALLVSRAGSRRQSAEEAERRKQQPLYVACADKLPREILTIDAGAGVTCGDGTLAAKDFGTYVALRYRSRTGRVAAGDFRRTTAAVFPNLGAPTTSASYPCRHVVALDLNPSDTTDAQMAAAVLKYKVAEGVVESNDRSGGNRYAAWKLGAGGVEAEGSDDGIIFRIYDGALPKAPASVQPTPWSDQPTCGVGKPPQLMGLRQKLVAAGWWEDDADAFTAAAVAVGQPDDAATANKSYIIAKLILHSKDWDEPQREILGRRCIAPGVSKASSGIVVPFDVIAGIDDKTFARLLPPPAPSGLGTLFVDQSGMNRERGRFDTSVGSALHARCVLDHLREVADAANWADVFSMAPFYKSESLTNATWLPAWSLASNPKYPKELYQALARSRANLIDTGDAADAGVASAVAQPSAPTATASASASTTQPDELAPEDAAFVDNMGGTGWGNRCWTHLQAGQLAWAKAACDRGLAMTPATPQPRASLLYNEGLVEQKLGHNAVARKFFEDSLALRPNPDVQRALDGLPP